MEGFYHWQANNNARERGEVLIQSENCCQDLSSKLDRHAKGPHEFCPVS
jgi:hypothetical protein